MVNQTKACVLAISWAVWKAKNDFIFKGDEINSFRIIKYANMLVSRSKIQVHSIHPTKRLLIPDSSSYKDVALVFIDASLRKSDGKCCFVFSIGL